MTDAAYPIVDVHQHTGPWPFAGVWGGIERNLHYLECRGIQAAIISSAEAIVDDMVAGNHHLAQDIADHDSLYAYVTVNPRYLDLSEREVETYRDDPRFVGFKVHTSYSATPMGEPRMTDLFALLEAHGKPLLIHTWGTGAVRGLATLAERFPRLPIVVAHAGGDAWREAIEAAQHRPNLYLDFALSSPERGRIERAIAALGPERVMFGSDATLFDPLYMLSCFAEADIADGDRPIVMGDNALRVFGLDLSPISPP
jgi:predicted TIM-barrel fold metal-dependent hydrolase